MSHKFGSEEQLSNVDPEVLARYRERQSLLHVGGGISVDMASRATSMMQEIGKDFWREMAELDDQVSYWHITEQPSVEDDAAKLDSEMYKNVTE